MNLRRPLITVHRRTYGCLYKLSTLNKWKEGNFFWITIVAIFLFYFICYLLCQLSFVLFLHLQAQFQTKFCEKHKYLDVQFHSQEIILQKQIHLQLQSLFSPSPRKISETELFPIVQKMLSLRHPICSYDSPYLVGVSEVNTDAAGIDENLFTLQKQLNKFYQLGKQVYLEQTSLPVSNNLQNASESALHTANKFVPFLPLSLDKIPIGVNSPSKCFAHRRTAIVIPYRNRLEHLKLFLRHIHSFLEKQEIEYGIYVINMAGDEIFNRGKLLNVGFEEALLHHSKYDCIIFHDVDLFPLDDRNVYTCNNQPKHMSVAINIFDFKVPYKEIFGGVTAVRPHQFRKLNGYSNEYWGWGGEDDDMYRRILKNCLSVHRISDEYARYYMKSHSRDKGNENSGERFNLVRGAMNRQPRDGISNLQYRAIHREYDFLYNNITVDIGHPEIRLGNSSDVVQRFLAVGMCMLLLYLLLFRSVRSL